MTTCNKAQANTSRPEETRLRLPDPGHNLPSYGELLASPFLGFFLLKRVDFEFTNEFDPPRFDQ